MSEIKQVLQAARDVVDACAGENRPHSGWARQVRDQIDTALSSAAVADREPAYWAVHSKTGMHIGFWPHKSDADEALRGYEGGTITALYLDPPPASELEAENSRLKAELDCALIREGNEKHHAKIAHQNMNAEINARERTEARLAEVEKALDGLLEPFEGDDCRYDHHGYCQAHFLQEGDECCVKIARSVREGWKVDG